MYINMHITHCTCNKATLCILLHMLTMAHVLMVPPVGDAGETAGV